MAHVLSTSSAQDLSALMRKLRKHTKTVVQENTIAKRTISKLRRKNAKLKLKIEQLQQHRAVSDGETAIQARMCRNCKEIVAPESSCIYHPGKFYDIDDGQRELDSESETFGLWSCCDAEQKDAIGCERGSHRFSR